MKLLSQTRLLWIGILTYLALAGCSSLQQSQINYPINYVDSVPFFPQEALECGPAALATILNYAGHKTTPDTLTDEVFTPGRSGTLRTDLIAGTRRFGMLPYTIDSYDELHGALSAELPVLVLLNLGLSELPQWHYAVVYGYEDDTYWLRSGTTREDAFSAFTFDQVWQRSGRWGLLALNPASRPPHFVQADKWLDSALGLERVEPGKALLAYSVGSDRWSSDGRFPFASGNLYYQKGETHRALRLFRRAVGRQPNFADAWNNLGHLYQETNQYQLAAEALSNAVALGGPRVEDYRASLDALLRLAPKK